MAHALHALAAGVIAVAMLSTSRAEGTASDAAATPPEPARQRELLTLLRQDCGSCHGLRLTGGLGPALTADALQSKPAEGMVATIQHGRPGTAMPPWSRFLSEVETRWLVGRMQSGKVDALR